MNELNYLNELNIQGLSLDSRSIQPGDAFVALKGWVQDGRGYIADAIQKGAVVVLSEVDEKLLSYPIPIIYYSNLRNTLGHIAAQFYEQPSLSMPVIGITGTNGKTSCSHFIAQMLKHCGKKCGIMGTLGNGLLNALEQSQCTTMDPIKTQHILFQLKEAGCDSVAMEVTSHALTQGRVEGTHFHTAIYTNLTRDHLDYHQTMQEYFLAKKRLFINHNPKFSVVNLDDEHGVALIKELQSMRTQESTESKSKTSASPSLIGYTLGETTTLLPPNAIVSAHSVELTDTGIKAIIHSPWGQGELTCSLLGRFNLSNILAALTAVCLQGIQFNEALKAIQQITTVSGRMMTLGGQAHQPTVVVDFAHTPDALSKVLNALRSHCRGQLWCVFGCGGDRDRGKRPLMAKVADELSDKIIVTQDNPRTEEPHRIIEDILSGFKKIEDHRVQVEPDRRKAIFSAILSANPNDIILVAGKGHEDYQIIGTQKLPFCDSTEVSSALERLETLDRRTQ